MPIGLLVCAGSLRAAEYYSSWAALRFNDLPAESGPYSDPDHDGEANLVEFAFGTDPRTPGDVHNVILPLLSVTNRCLSLEILERAGHQAGVQLDLTVSRDLTNWIRPWWQRALTNSRPEDPSGSVRESFAAALPAADRWFARARVQLLESGPENAKYYVATNGSDSNYGTNLSKPFATLGKAVGLANPGNLIYVRGGVYRSTSKISFSRSGTAAQPIRVRPYPGEQPVFDCSGAPTGTDALDITGNFWQVCGLEISNAGHNGIRISGSSNLVERCVVHDCRNTGIHLTAATYTPAYNLVLNCDSYRNYDAAGNGGDADGFSAKWTLGPGNTFRGCRAWENSDDGWDLWMGTAPVLLENCWAFRQGFDYWGNTNFAGNGNGFKLGGNYVPAAHRLAGCVSFENHAHGYDQNNNIAGQTVDQCTGWANQGRNFNLNHGTNTSPHVVRNNLSIGGGSTDSFRAGSLLTNNSWQMISPAATVTDLLSVDAAFALAPRRDDGGLPESPFLRPVPAGRLVDRGADLGLPYQGTAPDLGAFQSPEWQ